MNNRDAKDIHGIPLNTDIKDFAELRRRSSAFLRTIKARDGEGSLTWYSTQVQEFLKNSNTPQATVQHVLRHVREQPPPSDAEVNGPRDASPNPPATSRRLYGPCRRRIPMPTDEEVNLAVQDLSKEEWKALADEFEAEESKAHEVFDPPARQAVMHNDLGDMCDTDVATSTHFDMPITTSRFLGRCGVEITFDSAQWSSKLREESMTDHGIANNNNNCMWQTGPVPAAGAGATFAQEENVSVRRERFIRMRVRDSLIANCVVDDLENSVATAALSATAEVRRAEDENLRHFMKSQLQTINESIHIIQKIQEIDRLALNSFVYDKYRKQFWERDEAAESCNRCSRLFTSLVRHHHCRRCGLNFCIGCASYTGYLPDRDGSASFSPQWVRLCVDCFNRCHTHQRAMESNQLAPPSSAERATLAPENPSSIVLGGCPNSDGTLSDGMPPFLVPSDEWFAMKDASAKCVNSIYNMPHFVFEGIYDGASAFYGTAIPKLLEFFGGPKTSVDQTKKQIKEEEKPNVNRMGK